MQTRLYDDDTDHALRQAGLRAGVRVLDMGCRPGNVSFVAARLVGPTGTVLGADAAASVVELARTRAAETALWERAEAAEAGAVVMMPPLITA